MGSLGMPEILLILVIALIIFGPRKLPELGKTLGQSLAQFRRASEDFKRQWEDEVDMENRRIERAPAAPIEHFTYTEPSATTEATSSEAAADASPVAAAVDAPVVAHHSDTATKETKQDWM